MNTKDVILVVAGVAVGYLLAGYLKKSKDASVTETTVATDTTAPVVDQVKIDACNKKVDDFMASARFTKDADLDAIRKAKFDECMATK
jgi:hypothetical protein